MPLADKMRPKTLDEMVGQEHLIGEGMILRRMVESQNVGNLILYGPPGVGKTTFANIVSEVTNKKYIKLNAVNCGVKDIKDAINSAKKEGCQGVVLLIDEIQAMNKKQQQSLLEVIEDGFCTLIASTADNPYFVCYKAILSRCSVFEFKPIEKNDIIVGLANIIKKIKDEYKSFKVEAKAIEYIAETCNSDMRSAINKLELALNSSEDKQNEDVRLTLKKVMDSSSVKLINYDRTGDAHYDILSAFHKSCRGSDENAAVHYLARLIKAGDMQGITRRLLCLASEDVGLACPQAITIVNSCVQAAMQLGFPEARLPLTQATIYICKCPKSDSVTTAISNALFDIDNTNIGDVPLHLKDAHYSSAKKLGRGVDYKYPHNYENHFVEQQYLPDEIVDRVYYVPCNNSQERAMEDYWRKLKQEKKKI